MDDRNEQARALLIERLSAFDVPEAALIEAADALVALAIRRDSKHRQSENAVLALVAEGLPYSEIAKRTGVPFTTCHRIAARNGIDRGGDHSPQIRWTDEMETTLKGMWASGLSSSLIAKRLGVSDEAAKKKAHRLGLSRRAGQKIIRKDGRPLKWPSASRPASL